MKQMTISAVLCAASVASAATFTVISPSALPANAPKVQFAELPYSSTSFAAAVPTYSELGLTVLGNPVVHGWGGTLPSERFAALSKGGAGAVFSFDTPVSQVAFTQVWFLTTSITLYSDAAGTQSLGTFNTPQSYPGAPGPLLKEYAFESDTPFRSFSAMTTNFGTFQVDDLRYTAVPEPTVIGLAALGVGAVALRRRRA